MTKAADAIREIQAAFTAYRSLRWWQFWRFKAYRRRFLTAMSEAQKLRRDDHISRDDVDTLENALGEFICKLWHLDYP